MLAVHWTPVSKTKNILKNGIRKNKKGLFCFPLTGHHALDRWWVHFFNRYQVRSRKKYNGILFRITDDDMPAYFGQWFGATNWTEFEKEIKTTKELGKKFRDNLSFELGYRIASQKKLLEGIIDGQEMYKICMKQAKLAQNNDPKSLIEGMNSHDYMWTSLSDYQIVLSHSIPSRRILRVIPQGNEFGKVLKKRKKEKWKGDRY